MGEGWWVGIRVVQGITISSGGWVGWGAYMGKGGRGGVHPWVKKFFWSTPEVKK